MNPAAKLDPARTALVVIDVQEAFRKALEHFDAIVERVGVLIEGAEILGLPIVVTEQYPKGLGSTVEPVAAKLPEGVEPLDKSCFSAVEAEGFDLAGRDQALVCGIETHVCVNQSVLDLLTDDVEVQVAEDATGSRTTANWRLGLHKVERAGAVRTSAETALFELVGRAGTDEFKQIQGLVK